MLNSKSLLKISPIVLIGFAQISGCAVSGIRDSNTSGKQVSITPQKTKDISHIVQAIRSKKVNWGKLAPKVRSIGKPIIPSLLPLLKEPDKEVRTLTITALGYVGEPAMLHLIPLLKGQDAQDTAIVMVVMGEPAVPALISLLKDQDLVMQNSAIMILSEMKLSEKAVPKLVQYFQEVDDNESMIVLGVLFNIGDPAIGPVAALLKHPDPKVRKRATLFLDTMKTQHPDQRVRERAVFFLEAVKKQSG